MSIDEELGLLNRMKEMGRWMVFSAVGVFASCLSFLVAYVLAPPHDFGSGSPPVGVVLGLMSILCSVFGLYINNVIKRKLRNQLPQDNPIHL
jgi:hypothetical protein